MGVNHEEGGCRWADLLPPLLVLTDRGQAARLGLVGTLAAAVEGGARAILLREKDLARAERADLGHAIHHLLAPVGGVLVTAGPDVDLARAVGATGVHLARTDRLPVDTGGLLVGRSCHDRVEVQVAAAEGADYATISPVLWMSSKPGYGPALGMDGLAEMSATTDLPLIALGGISEDSASDCLRAGAAGVAIMGAVMASADPAETVRRLAEVVSLASAEGARR